MRTKKKILWTLVLAAILIAAWVGYNTGWIWMGYLTPPPVKFLENNHIRCGLYPGGNQSVAVFTNDDICSSTPPEVIERLRDRLQKLEIRGTFFVIPEHRESGRLQEGTLQVDLLRKLAADGHEIAQHGFSHYCEKNRGRGVKMGAEMIYLSCSEQVERIREGRDILVGLGFKPLGHRSPCFSGNEDTFRALEKLGFLYGSDLDLPPTTPRTLFTPILRRGLLYPYHPDGLRLLEITSQSDPTVRLEKVKKVFERFHEKGGVFVFLTHVPDIGNPRNLDLLEDFIRYLQTKDVWICPMEDIVRWWLARENLGISTMLKDGLLIISCENSTSYPLEDIEIVFRKTASPLEKYVLRNQSGEIMGEGRIPPSRKVSVTIPSQ